MLPWGCTKAKIKELQITSELTGKNENKLKAKSN